MCKPRQSNNNSPQSIRKVARNLGEPLPVDKKVKMIARNLWLRVAKMELCCGHPGEPGC